MQNRFSRRKTDRPDASNSPALYRFRTAVAASLLAAAAGCQTSLPSARLAEGVNLPVPQEIEAADTEERLFFTERTGDRFPLSARMIASVAFDRHPTIRSQFRRFKSQEARYDFFYTSRDSLTPRLRSDSTVSEVRAPGAATERERSHNVSLSLERRFFDTTELDVGVGYSTYDDDVNIGYQPTVSASLSYPLWVSRKRLERTSEEIFRRNEVDDAQLAYIQSVRGQLMHALWTFQTVLKLKRNIEVMEFWLADLHGLADRMGDIEGRDLTTDRSRLDAEIERVGTLHRNDSGRFLIDVERLKDACGLPFHTDLELIDDAFNPFEGATQKDLMRLSIETDPEIATLRNAMRNAEVQLDLARRGRWDLSLALDGASTLEGGGGGEGDSNWWVNVGVEVSAVDPRVTQSLMRQAEANIVRFREAIAARENTIFVDTLEPLVRIDTLGASRDQLRELLPQYVDDYTNGIEEYIAGVLNMDDLISRRENLARQQFEVSELTFMVGVNVAELCAATGKFFEILEANGRTHVPEGA